MLLSKFITLIIAAVIILLAGCDNMESELDHWQPDGLVTVTNEVGIIISIDEYDWDYDSLYEVGDTSLYEVGDTISNIWSTSGGMVPNKYRALPPYPNPVQSDTAILYYQMPAASQVYLYLFNIEGDTLVFIDAFQFAGNHRIKIDLTSSPDGFYHCVLDLENIIIEGDISVETAAN